MREPLTARSPLPADPPTEQGSFSDEALLLTDAPVPGRAPSQRAPRKGLQIEAVSDWTQLAAVQDEWQALAEQSAEPNPFYEPWMLLPALRHFAGAGRVQVLLAYAPQAKGKRELVGVFPMERRRGRLDLWHHPYCYLTAPLLQRGAERAALAGWLDWLAEQAAVVRLEDVPGDGPVRLHLLDELHQRGWPSLVSEAYTRAVLRPAASADEFLVRALAGKRRKELRRQRSRLAEQGVLATEEFAPGDDPLPWIDEFIALESAGWKGREGVSAEGDRAFMQEMAVGAAQRGQLQMLALRLGGKPVALKLNLMAGQGGFAFKITFDEAFSRFSPGVQLELDNVERAHRLAHLRYMDSCAAPNRFMINHLWPDRREMQTLFFSTGGFFGALAVALVPLLHLFRSRVRSG
jgi:CelD/BcsL family acetyltransferase involved in cellulose biosynthesis